MASLDNLKDRLRAEERRLSECQSKIRAVREQIWQWKAENWVRCVSCNNFRAPEYMEIATQEDADEWWKSWDSDNYFQDEHYNHHGPSVGEWYCGC
jgi:hypothetical protein